MSVILKQFDGGAISPRDDAILYNSIIQRNGIFNGCEITHLGANQVKITAGRGIIKGRTFEIEEMTVNCQLASYGTQKGRMYLRMELSNLETPIQIKTVAATSLPDLVQEEDCNYTNGVYEMELCTYNVTDVLISGIKMTYDAIDTAFPIARSLEEAEGVTDPDVLANALSVGQLSRELLGHIVWTNPNPASNFAAQSVTLSESINNYSYAEIVYKGVNHKGFIKTTGKLPIVEGLVPYLEFVSDYAYRRQVTEFSGTTITFADAMYFSNPSTSHVTNNLCIPYQIILYAL